MDHDIGMHKDKNGKEHPEIIVLPDADISEPDTYSDDDTLFTSSILNELSDEQECCSSDESNSEIDSEINWEKERNYPGLPEDLCNINDDFEEVCNLNHPIDYFNLFFDSELLELIVVESNKYASLNNSSFQTNTSEIKLYLGVLILMGIVKMPRYRCYWSQNFHYAPISDTLSRDRFEQLSKYLHFNDNNYITTDQTSEKFDRFAKIRPFLEHLRLAFLKISPETINSVDEQMIPFKGKCKAKQYMPKKPTKWGFKVFARCGKSGIVYDFYMYEGKPPIVRESCGLSSGDSVIKLCEHLSINKKFILYFDNWFTSFRMQLILKKRGIYSVGTIRNNRIKGCPLLSKKELMKTGRGAFDSAQASNHPLVVTRWYDSSIVTLSSTHSSVEPLTTLCRFDRRQKRRVKINCPSVVLEYNKNMGGVDLSDMLMSLYKLNHKCKKYYMRIFFGGLNTAITNSWLLYKRQCILKKKKKNEKQDLLCFTYSICESLLYQNQTAIRKRKRGRPNNETLLVSKEEKTILKNNRNVVLSDQIRYDNVGHYPEMISKPSRCRECGRNTQIICLKCGAPCCLVRDRNCFYHYHTN